MIKNKGTKIELKFTIPNDYSKRKKKAIGKRIKALLDILNDKKTKQEG